MSKKVISGSIPDHPPFKPHKSSELATSLKNLLHSELGPLLSKLQKTLTPAKPEHAVSYDEVVSTSNLGAKNDEVTSFDMNNVD